MPEDTDIIEVRAVSQIAPAVDEFINVFHYYVTNSSDWSLNVQVDEFATEWADAVWDAIKATQSDAISLVRLEVQNLMNADDFGEHVFSSPIAGAVASDVLPPFVSYNWQLKRALKTTRSGYKRITGVPESWVNNGQIVSGHELAIASAANVLSTNSTLTLTSPVASTVDIKPVIVRKDATGAFVLANNIVDAQLNGLGTQSTRKYGRGS